MKEMLTEAITRNLVEKNEPFAVARKLVDEKIMSLIPHLKDGSCISIRNVYTDIAEFEIHRLESIEIFIREKYTDKAVVISKSDIEKAFQILRFDSLNAVNFETAVEAIHMAFDRLPKRCQFFEYTEDGIIFNVNI